VNELLLPIWLKFILAFAWAAFSGFVAYLQQYAVKRGDRPKWDWLEAFIRSLTAGAAGIFTVLVVQKLSVDMYTAAFMIGIAGWGGVETFSFFKEIFQDGIRRAARGMGGAGEDEDKAAPH
jgi:hypothetical protein